MMEAGFGLFWCPSVFVVNVCKSSAQFMHCEILHKSSGKCFAITFIYGFNCIVA